jgi:hypothetical protein
MAHATSLGAPDVHRRRSTRQANPRPSRPRQAIARRNVQTRRLDDGSPTHSFSTLLAELAAITRNTCRANTKADAPTFDVFTTPNPKQNTALELINAIKP